MRDVTKFREGAFSDTPLLQGLLAESGLTRVSSTVGLSLYDENVKMLSLQDYKSIVETHSHSLAIAFVKYSRFSLKGKGKERTGRMRDWKPREVIYGTPMLQGLLAQSILKSDEPLTDSLSIPGLGYEVESLEKSRQSLRKLYMSTISRASFHQKNWDFVNDLLKAIESDLSEYKEVLEANVLAFYNGFMKRLGKGANWNVKLSPKAMAIILKHVDIGKRWGFLSSTVDGTMGTESGRRSMFLQIVRLLDGVQFEFTTVSKNCCRLYKLLAVVGVKNGRRLRSGK
jgi:hypothetical protein